MDVNNEDYPLVSVVVATYNSSATVIETLESIKNQTYHNIELIVTDDCSTDNTVIICQKWLSENKKYFIHSDLVTTLQNTGVSGNFNRGIFQSKGEWIKSIAGDDLLIPTAIEEYVYFVKNHAEKVRMCVCDVEPFVVEGEGLDKIVKAYKNFFEKESEPYEQQRKRVMTSLVFVGPAYFYSRELFDEIGGYSDKYGCAEEWPFVYKIIRGGNRIYAINKKLVLYRFQTSSLCNSRDNKRMKNKNVFLGMYRHYFDCAFKDLIYEGHILIAWHYALIYWSQRIQYNISSIKLRQLCRYCFLVFSPFAWLNKLGIIKVE